MKQYNTSSYELFTDIRQYLQFSLPMVSYLISEFYVIILV